MTDEWYRESLEWNKEKAKEYISTLRFVIRMIEDNTERSLFDLKDILQGCIDREVEFWDVG